MLDIRVPSQLEVEIFNGQRLPHELFWVKYQPFLLRHGYQLRPRYRPEWVPSWRGHDIPIKHIHRYEDSMIPFKFEVLDATRLLDNRKVVLKLVETSTEELPICLYLSSPELSKDPRNNAVPILDVLLLPDDDQFAFIVMPMLYMFHALPFLRVGEFAEAMRQMSQGLLFMHEHNIAHRDPCLFNMMVDATDLLPQGWHFFDFLTYDGINMWSEWRERGSCKNLRYYFIDFDLSKRYHDNVNILDVGTDGQDKTYPERSSTIPYDPFKTDIYLLGNAFLEVIEEYDGLGKLRAIAKPMTRKVPNDRAQLAQIMKRIDQLSTWRLKSRVWKKDNPYIVRFLIQFCGYSNLRT